MEFPSTPWREQGWVLDEAIKEAPVTTSWRALPGSVRHTFTHFHLELTVLVGRIRGKHAEQSIWCTPECFADYALPTVMKKVSQHVFQAAYPGVQND